ncbi:ankyrin repeat and SOCS box protein 11 isoform X2 [Latimeria chalumnae]|uniref:ankyrin repeat and SOCS box protein 11 isoform X2 n=1 Tax=Latimeria chalumnae TaxID=7897 RepID=UPI0003C18EE6|nr:PREDICTED: ankyrin repeat and SOCS box protein 11 isoform X2 [Latimeria chalumnae]|eukprot:XP_006009506.1 PREDICTED: ankyrin repeat and SOCS box protein 11 isoform X2 [Latimeria chalumnae]
MMTTEVTVGELSHFNTQRRNEISGISSLPWDLRNILYGDHICHTFQGGSWADRSPLHEAAYQGRLLSLKTLIAQGFHVNIVTIDRVSALHEACLGGHVACAKVLLENGAKVNAVTIDGITPLFNACCSGSVACVNVLLEYGAKPQLECLLASPIHETVKRGHRECMETLLANGVNIDQEVPHFGTPLYVACMFQRIDCAKKLLELGASVHLGKLSDAPLHAAARNSSAEVINLLIDYGADTKSRNAEGKRPLELAAPNSAVERAMLLREGPAALTQLCRLCIRKCLGRPCLTSISRLQLPHRLKEFLLYR